MTLASASDEGPRRRSLLNLRRGSQARRGHDLGNEFLLRITDPTLTSYPVDDLVSELLGSLLEVSGATVAGLAVRSEAGVLVVSEMRTASGPRVVDADASPIGAVVRCVEQAEPILIGDATADGGPLVLGGHELRSVAASPMGVAGNVFGAVFLGSGVPSSLRIDDLRWAQRVADRLALVFDHQRLTISVRESGRVLAEGRARLASVVDAAPVAMLELDVNGRVQGWNLAASQLLSWPLFDEAVVPTLLDARLASAVADVVRGTRRGRRVRDVEAQLLRSGAPAVTLSLSGAPMLDADGNLVAVIVLLNDVSERRQLEQQIRQSQRLDAMARLAGGVAHDFNNLLTVVIGYSQFLLKDLPKSSPIRSDIEAIYKAGERASELTNQLLTIGRRQVVEPVIVDVQEHVRDLEPIVRRLAGDQIELRVVTGAAPSYVRVDAHEFEQVIMNLAINARDAMPTGGRLVIESRTIDLDTSDAAATSLPAGPSVLVTVADTGCGMADDVREHCFDPFFTTKGRGEGTGLGLAAVYGVVTQSGGHVDLVTDPGRGTTFRLFFPVATEGPAPKAPRERSTRRTKPRTGRVLLVEDEHAVRGLVRSVLLHHGHTVVDVDSAEAALALAAKVRQPFDVLVSDIVMPGLHGDALANELVVRWPNLKVLLVSGYADRAAGLDPERITFLAKPFALDDLADRVQDLLPPPPPRRRPAPKTPPPPTDPPARATRARTGTPRRARSGPTLASAPRALSADGLAGHAP